LVVVSHSAALAEAARDLAAQMGGDDVRIETAGGGAGNPMGASVESVESALERASSPEGVVLLGDLGSAIIAIKAVLADQEEGAARLADAPLVEGLVAAAVTAGAGGSIDAVVQAAEDARTASKT
jgi:dihydroxyacetone kinase DhaKLM complex PTS-EIIA-like component DhaM